MLEQEAIVESTDIKPVVDPLPSSLIDFLTKNFAVLSTSLLGISSALTIVFIYSYLVVYDWRLIWLVEYSDIAKFILVIGGLLSSILFSIPLLLHSIELSFGAVKKRIIDKNKFKFTIWSFIIAYFLIKILVWKLDIKGLSYIDWLFFSIFASISAAYFSFDIYESYKSKSVNYDWTVISNLSMLYILCMISFGTAFGQYNKDKLNNKLLSLRRAKRFLTLFK